MRINNNYRLDPCANPRYLYGANRLVECGNTSSDESQTTDGEVESDKEDGGGGTCWGGLRETTSNNAAVEVGVQGAMSAVKEREAARKQRNGNKKDGKGTKQRVSKREYSEHDRYPPAAEVFLTMGSLFYDSTTLTDVSRFYSEIPFAVLYEVLRMVNGVVLRSSTRFASNIQRWTASLFATSFRHAMRRQQ